MRVKKFLTGYLKNSSSEKPASSEEVGSIEDVQMLPSVFGDVCFRANHTRIQLTGGIPSDISREERRLLRAMALYRQGIPQNHRRILEQKLSVVGVWPKLVSKDLIVADVNPWHVTLPVKIKRWLQLEENDEGDEQIIRFHGIVASCWLQQLGNAGLSRSILCRSACEALYHTVAAKDEKMLRRVSPDLLFDHHTWAVNLLKNFYDELYQQKVPTHRQKELLGYRLLLEPQNHAVCRFLAQCVQREEGVGSRKAIELLEKACSIRPDYPPYWADLGKALLATGRDGAQKFLDEIECVRKVYPDVVNSYIESVVLACHKLVSGHENAELMRREHLLAESHNPALYADSAMKKLRDGHPDKALEIIELAEERRCSNDVLVAVKANVYEQLGRHYEASAIRTSRIVQGSSNPALYCAEAKSRLAKGCPEAALDIIFLARKRNIVNDYLVAVQANALVEAGRPEEATVIRLRQIEAESRNSVFYNDEAKFRIRSGDVDGAREILTLAVFRNCANKYTSILWDKVSLLLSRDDHIRSQTEHGS